jgi:hypothetical protein
MMRRRRAEGSIYTGKRQDTKWWSSLPYYNITFFPLNIILDIT